uniref:RWD domain-containing protein n=1 Tax=Eptatretus burgeri TaxID=7764 RepID=A0A8C4R122_EPTBU
MDGGEEVKLQVVEIDLLCSMFPGEGELTLVDPSVLPDLRAFSEGQLKEAPSTCLDLSIDLRLGDAGQNKVILRCVLPTHYPSVAAEVYARASSLSRRDERSMNAALAEHLEQVSHGEPCVVAAVAWLQDNWSLYFTENDEKLSKQDKSGAQVKEKTFTRLWIYSHHIYNKVKRRDIVAWARDLGLSGFCLPGKPGIVCVEGAQEACEEYWTRLRRLSWHHIAIKHREDIPVQVNHTAEHDSEREFEPLRRFPPLEEKAFQVRDLEQENRLLEVEIQTLRRSGGQPSGLRALFVAELRGLQALVQSSRQQRDMAVAERAALEAELAAVKKRYEEATGARRAAQDELEAFRPDVDKVTSRRLDLELQIELLERKLEFLKSVQSEEINELLAQIHGTTAKVEMEYALPDLTTALRDIRAQYEDIASKNLKELDDWYKAKFSDVAPTASQRVEDFHCLKKEVSDSKLLVWCSILLILWCKNSSAPKNYT